MRCARLLIGLAIFLNASACAAGEVPPSPAFDSLEQSLGPAPDFALTERGGQTVRRADLLGKVWVVNFFYTGCAICPQTTASMARLHESLADKPGVVLVSVSVNPADDTPERLREYARGLCGDSPRWLFLTGDEARVHELIEKGFFQSVRKVPEGKPGFEIDHTFRMIVVDPAGEMRGYISDGKDAEQVGRLEARVRQLARNAVLGPLLPAVNASLNGVCTLLLVAGYVAVRRRRLTLHKALMLAALLVSAVFLASYLYYHFVIGRQTPFTGEGAARIVYFVVLFSHIFLAALVAPLALTTAYLGLRGRLAGHTRLARWTLPIWLYVSVTGVIVYVMLYHLYAPS